MFKKRNIQNLIPPCSNSLLGFHQTLVVFHPVNRKVAARLARRIKRARHRREAVNEPCKSNNLHLRSSYRWKIVIWCKMLPAWETDLQAGAIRLQTLHSVTLSTAAGENSEQTDSLFTIFCHFCIWPKATDA